MSSDDTLDDCGCAPATTQRRRLLPVMSRRSALGLGLVGAATLAALGGPLLPAAFAADYPTWDEVVAARASESAKAAEVAKIQNLIQQLAADLEAKQAAAKVASDAFFTAQQEFFDASYKADQLQASADAQATTAADAATKAGRVAAQLYRNGGDDTSLELFFSGSAAGTDDLLAQLGTMDKLMERNQDVYSAAITARDAAQSLSDQAVVARNERDRLQQVAEQKMLESQQAADEAQAALELQNQKRGELEAQLAALQDTTARTVAEYQEGERIRREAEAAAAAAAAEAARAAAANSGGGGGGGGGGSVGGAGWARPSSGWRSSDYGPRTVQCGNSYCSSGFHYGVDLAAGCGAGIYAASSGTVVYAGWNGGYGNYIKIDHGGGIGTGYGHIRPGGIFVGYGQWVNAGQLIASEGNTGNSFGCHVHFEVYNWGSPINPVDFMAARGVWV